MQLIQDAAAHSLLGTQLFQCSIPFLKSLCWLLVKFCVKIKGLRLVQAMLDVTLVPFAGSMFLIAQQDHNYYCKGMWKELEGEEGRMLCQGPSQCKNHKKRRKPQARRHKDANLNNNWWESVTLIRLFDIIRLILVRLSDLGPCQWDDKDKREAINQRLKLGRQLQWEKRQGTNLDVSSQEESLLRKGKLLNKRNFLLKNYCQKRPVSLEPRVWEPGTGLIRPAGLLEVQPEYLQTGDMGRSHPFSHLDPHSPSSHLCEALMLCVCHINFSCLVLSWHLKLQQLKYCGGIHPSLSQNLRMSPLVITFWFSSSFYVLYSSATSTISKVMNM